MEKKKNRKLSTNRVIVRLEINFETSSASFNSVSNRDSPRGHARRDHFVKLHGLLGSIEWKGQGWSRDVTRRECIPSSKRKIANPCLGVEGGRKGEGESPRDGNPGKGYLLSWSLMLHYWLKMAGLPAGWLDGWLAQSWRHFNMRNYNVYLEPSGKGGWGERCTKRYQCRVEHGTSQEIQSGEGGGGEVCRVGGGGEKWGIYSSAGDPSLPSLFARNQRGTV